MKLVCDRLRQVSAVLLRITLFFGGFFQLSLLNHTLAFRLYWRVEDFSMCNSMILHMKLSIEPWLEEYVADKTDIDSLNKMIETLDECDPNFNPDLKIISKQLKAWQNDHPEYRRGLREKMIDKILLSIFQRAFKAINDEMSISLSKIRHSHTPWRCTNGWHGLLAKPCFYFFSFRVELVGETCLDNPGMPRS